MHIGNNLIPYYTSVPRAENAGVQNVHGAKPAGAKRGTVKQPVHTQEKRPDEKLAQDRNQQSGGATRKVVKDPGQTPAAKQAINAYLDHSRYQEKDQLTEILGFDGYA
jgi:hypothetical protein